MSLSAGDRLGPYEILAPLGSGGMGEVWRARDTRLNRDVAIKRSSALFSDRFEREARAIAALNHPNICQIYDVGKDYIVMELVDGAPVKGPLPLDQALKLAIELAGALEAAHRKNITHRDLKPANILNTKSGVKVLDFGLAKVEEKKVAGPDDVTFARALTQQGTIVGTLQYMAPEQVQGKEVDSRADIFSFGCVLYEMLTGKRAFDGENTASVIGAILERDAPSIGSVVPAPLDRVIKTCLAKDPDDRWQTARDLRRELEWIAAGGGTQQVAAQAKARVTWVPWTVAAAFALGAAALAFVHFREAPPEAPVARFTISPPGNTHFHFSLGAVPAWPVISPDGRKLVFRAVSAEGKAQLWIRSLDAVDPQPLAGTDDAYLPFWSPDGKSIAFGANGKLQRMELAGGPPLSLADIGPGSGFSGSWGSDGTILFARAADGPILRVPASGGPVTVATRLNSTSEAAHRLPRFLPGGKNFVFDSVQRNGVGSIRAASLGALDSKSLDIRAAKAVYASGYLLFTRGGTLMAQSFDPDRLATTGAAVPVAEHILGPSFDASVNGTLLYAAGLSEEATQLTWYDRTGGKLGVVGTPAVYTNPALSPDGKRLAVSIGGTQSRDIWIFDLARGVPTRFTFDPKDDLNPVWSHDGSRIAFSSERAGPRNVYLKAASGMGAEEILVDSKESKSVEDWSPDGKFILYNVGTAAIWAVPVAGDRKPFPVLDTAFTEVESRISPDGHWIAYRSDESGGRPEVFIQSFPPSAGKWQISNSGGRMPSWRADGRELFYENATQIMAVDIKLSGAGVEAGIPKELFEIPNLTQDTRRNNYVVTPDGQRFLCLTMLDSAAATPLTLVLNWPSALKK